MKRIAILPNVRRDDEYSGTNKIIKYLNSRGIQPVLDKSLEIYGFDASFTEIEKAMDVDMAVIIGGDGTMLSMGKQYINTDIPVLGINYGNVGFLTELEKDDFDGFTHIIENGFLTEKRPIIQAEHMGEKYFSINEVSLHRGISPKILDIDIIISDVMMNSFCADGVIVATSSGSTAYSLSAGGPIIDPSVNAFVVTPVCPNNIHLRSIVVSDKVEIAVCLKDSESGSLSVDGNLVAEIKGDSKITIKHGGYLKTVIRNPNSFYKKLKTKIFEKEI